jgi:adenylosuccinate synthase
MKGKKISYTACGYKELAEVKPVYKTFKGWKEDLSQIRKFNDLPETCRYYLNFIEKYLGVPIKLISVGAERNQNVLK